MATCINCGNKSVEVTLKDKSADPHAYGFFGFGLTTVLLNIHNAGYFKLDSMILAMAICFGGLCQIMAGIMNYLKGALLPGFAFCAFGFFWVSFALITLLVKAGLAEGPSNISMAYYLAIWGLLVIVLFVYTLYHAPIVIQVLFMTVVVLFYLLAFAKGFKNETLEHIAGWEGIICGLLAMYAGASAILNTPEKTIIPMGKNYCFAKKKTPQPHNDSTDHIKGSLDSAKAKGEH
jgi:succinate-acetate transporter protein